MQDLEQFLSKISITIIAFLGAFFIANYNHNKKGKYDAQAKRIKALNQFFILINNSHIQASNIKLRYETLNSNDPIQRVLSIPYIDLHNLKPLTFDFTQLAFIISNKYKVKSLWNKFCGRIKELIMANYQHNYFSVELPPKKETNNHLVKFYSYLENYNYLIHVLSERNELKKKFDETFKTENSLSKTINWNDLKQKFGINYLNDLCLRTEHLTQIVDFIIFESADILLNYHEEFNEFIDKKILNRLQEPFLHSEPSEKWGKGIYTKTCKVDYNKLSEIFGLKLDEIYNYYKLKF